MGGLIRLNCSTPKANQLLLEGAQALAIVEHNGIRIDEAYLDSALEQTGKEIAELELKLRSDKLWSEWKRKFGTKSQMGNRQQLGSLLIEMGYKPKRVTEKRKLPKIDEEFLAGVDEPFVKDYLKMQSLEKSRNTFLVGLKREVVNGFVHPFFNLNTVETFRSSADSPNVQNQIVRDDVMGELVRRCYVPRKGNVLVEIDYSALEFRIAACFWKDPVMVQYVKEGKDPHLDSACELFGLKPEIVKQNKPVRHLAKNRFVFPQLYGSYYIQCASKMWEMMAGMKLVDGSLLLDVLAKQGIEDRGDCDSSCNPKKGTFEHRVKEAEDRFYRRFAVVAREKPRWWQKYQETGGFRMMTGFWLQGIYSRNFLCNAPVQGPAFHCLLWSMNKIVLRELRKRKMKAKVVAEIHDSLLGDVPEEEVQEYIGICKKVMTEDVVKHWSWIIVPLAIEIDVAADSWAGKVPWTEKDGIWGPKT